MASIKQCSIGASYSRWMALLRAHGLIFTCAEPCFSEQPVSASECFRSSGKIVSAHGGNVGPVKLSVCGLSPGCPCLSPFVCICLSVQGPACTHSSSVCLSVCMCVCVSLSLSISLYLYIYIYIYIYILCTLSFLSSLSLSLSANLKPCMGVCLHYGTSLSALRLRAFRVPTRAYLRLYPRPATHVLCRRSTSFP